MGTSGSTTKRCERFSDQFLIGMRTIDFGRIEERNATLDRSAQESNHLVPVGYGSVGPAHAHTAEAESRNFQRIRSAVSEFAFLHD